MRQVGVTSPSPSAPVQLVLPRSAPIAVPAEAVMPLWLLEHKDSESGSERGP